MVMTMPTVTTSVEQHDHEENWIEVAPDKPTTMGMVMTMPMTRTTTATRRPTPMRAIGSWSAAGGPGGDEHHRGLGNLCISSLTLLVPRRGDADPGADAGVRRAVPGHRSDRAARDALLCPGCLAPDRADRHRTRLALLCTDGLPLLRRTRLKAAQAAHRFGGVYSFLVHKWYFDELYGAVLVRPCLEFARICRELDRILIDGLVNGAAALTALAEPTRGGLRRDRRGPLVNLTAKLVYVTGDKGRLIQTGRLRNYLMFLTVGPDRAVRGRIRLDPKLIGPWSLASGPRSPSNRAARRSIDGRMAIPADHAREYKTAYPAKNQGPRTENR